jgi:hypothetical protein
MRTNELLAERSKLIPVRLECQKLITEWNPAGNHWLAPWFAGDLPPVFARPVQDLNDQKSHHERTRSSCITVSIHTGRRGVNQERVADTEPEASTSPEEIPLSGMERSSPERKQRVIENIQNLELLNSCRSFPTPPSTFRDPEIVHWRGHCQKWNGWIQNQSVWYSPRLVTSIFPLNHDGIWEFRSFRGKLGRFKSPIMTVADID